MLDTTKSDYIYHYTSIENLSLILNYRKIKFTRLDMVNDPEEAPNIEGVDIRKNLMVSCWTGKSEETIPMWTMYTGPKQNGVRIKVKSDILETNRHFGKNRYLFQMQDIIYSDESSYSIVENNVDEIGSENGYTWFWLFPPRLATYKKQHWSFEEEKRFVIVSSKPCWTKNDEDKKTVLKELIKNDFEENSLFVETNNTSFFNMEITLGPGCSEAQKLIVNALCEKYKIKPPLDNSLSQFKK